MTLLIFVVALILLAVLARAVQVPFHHRWRRRQAKTMCASFRGPDVMQSPGRVYARLRAMDPLAFEELLLESFAARGHKVRRNRRYTGDGGIDGQVIIGGRVWLIQAKRYASAIRPEHVAAFANVCRSRRSPGIFIHTGRTGALSRAAFDGSGQIELISGEKLIALLSGAPLQIGGVAV